MNIGFCSSEVVPFAKTGGLADVCGALPLALEKLGLDVTVFLPWYRCVKQAGHLITEVEPGLGVTTMGKNIQVYFIDHPHFFAREGLYGNADGDYKDNLERFQFFCSQVLFVLKKRGRAPDILHCHDWQTALIPVYLKEQYRQEPFYAKTKTVLTIHNLAYQGVFPAKSYPKLGLPPALFHQDVFEFFDKVNLLKAGIVYADEITTVSPRYAREIQTKDFGCGLQGVLQSRREKIVGILNGLDYDLWNPQTDSFLVCHYHKDNVQQAKRENKQAVTEVFDLPSRPDTPLFGFVARLTHQKGVDLILASIDTLVQMDIQVIIQGIGEEKYHSLLTELAFRYPEKVGVCLEFCERTAHLIYAGCDFFLMPSLFEPCGLSQMISLRYGTIPIVFETGGLVDTIEAFDPVTGKGNGFVFHSYHQSNFIDVIQQAVDVFQNKELFVKMIHNAMAANFCWEKAARDYQKVYQCVLSA